MTGVARIIRAKRESSSFWCQSWCASPFMFLRYKFAIGTKGPLPYNYFSDCDWEWVLKDLLLFRLWLGVSSERFCQRWYVLWQHWYVFFYCNMHPMPVSTTISQVLSIVQLMSPISKTLMNAILLLFFFLSPPDTGAAQMFWTGKSHWGPLLVGNPKKKGNTNAFQTWVISHIQLIFSYWSKSHVLLRKSISWRYLQNESIWIYFDWQDILLLLSPTTLFMLWSCQQCRKYACNVIYKSMQQEKSSRVGLKWIWKIITIISSIPTSPHPLP